MQKEYLQCKPRPLSLSLSGCLSLRGVRGLHPADTLIDLFTCYANNPPHVGQDRSTTGVTSVIWVFSLCWSGQM